MGVVLLHILQWILRVILFFILLLLVLTAIILIVPIRYQAEGEFLKKKPGVRGKVTWFFYLIYVKFYYEEEFHIQVRACGFKVFDSMSEKKKTKNKKKTTKNTQNEISEESSENTENEIGKNNVEVTESNRDKDTESQSVEISTGEVVENKISENTAERTEINNPTDAATVLEAEMQTEAVEEAESLTSAAKEETKIEEENVSEKEKKSLSEKIEDVKAKIQGIIQKIKDIIAKIRDGKLKVEHYLELWNRDETQITFSRAKTKLGRMIKAVLPRKWEVTGEIGFADPCTTGQLMGALGAMYPILGNKVQLVPNFENEVLNFKGHLKGHIRLGNLLYQIVSLLLNRYCFKFIKLIFDELSGSKKKTVKNEV